MTLKKLYNRTKLTVIKLYKPTHGNTVIIRVNK